MSRSENIHRTAKSGFSPFRLSDLGLAPHDPEPPRLLFKKEIVKIVVSDRAFV